VHMSGIDRRIAEALGVSTDVERIVERENMDVLDLAAALGEVEALSSDTRFLLAVALSRAEEFRARCLIPHSDGDAADLRPVFDPIEGVRRPQAPSGEFLWVCNGDPQHRTSRIADVSESAKNGA
jgi:hypothetical protein